jgi:dihydrolipoamide dehydrogenase
MSMMNILIVGAGPGGYTAAFLAAELGMKVTLVDNAMQPGGVCLHRGCIPSKALLHLAKLIAETRQARSCGLGFGDPEIDLSAVRNWKNQVVNQMASGLVTLSKQRKVTLVAGHAVFKDSHTVIVSGKEELKFDHAIVAVGSSPVMPKEFLSLNSSRLMDSTTALDLPDIPKRLLIVGGGYIGLEMGTVYSALGSKVTVVEMLDGLLTGVDRDLVRLLQNRLNKEFESIHLKTKVSSLVETDQGLTARLEGDGNSCEQTFDRVLVSVGRKPNSGGIGLENTKVKIDERGFVQVGNNQSTDDPAISAIGDIVGGVMLAHKASHEARVAVGALAGEAQASSSSVMPAVVFTDPEIAWCGLTETEAKLSGKEIVVSKFPWGASGRATTLGRNDGATKLILEPDTGRILGVGIVGVGAGELISEGALAVNMGATASDLMATIHPHPTLSETLMESAEVFFGKSTHFYRKK